MHPTARSAPGLDCVGSSKHSPDHLCARLCPKRPHKRRTGEGTADFGSFGDIAALRTGTCSPSSPSCRSAVHCRILSGAAQLQLLAPRRGRELASRLQLYLRISVGEQCSGHRDDKAQGTWPRLACRSLWADHMSRCRKCPCQRLLLLLRLTCCWKTRLETGFAL